MNDYVVRVRHSCKNIVIKACLFIGALRMSNEQIPEGKPPMDLRTLTQVAYGLFAIGLLSGGMFGIATIAAMVLLYLKRPEAAGTVYASHFDWLMQTFWWGLLALAISWIATYIYIGWVGIVATGIWILYRLVKGWLALLEWRAPQ
jgi:uncharacterized membrane protein